MSLCANSSCTPRVRCTNGHTLSLSPLFSAISCVLPRPAPHSLWCTLPSLSTGSASEFLSPVAQPFLAVLPSYLCFAYRHPIHSIISALVSLPPKHHSQFAFDFCPCGALYERGLPRP